MREWKPGDVASVLFDGMQPAFRTQRGWTFIDGSTSAENADGYGFRPLVVIDPEDRDQVERFARAVFEACPKVVVGISENNPAAIDRLWCDSMQAGLRSQIEPPKPAEPDGIGAVVEDADRGVWVRDRHNNPGYLGVVWLNIHTQAHRHYADLDAVRVLSEGVRDV